MRNHCCTALLAMSLLLVPGAGPAQADDAAPAQDKPTAPQKCLEALVNPVSGHAECVRPPGAPVEQMRRADLPCQLHSASSGASGQGCADEPPGKEESKK
ncbi:MAG: hypothetical protein JWR07_1593 [Nevskia sp.]|nr:hypothetical protein [Nevskia sp.]